MVKNAEAFLETLRQWNDGPTPGQPISDWSLHEWHRAYCMTRSHGETQDPTDALFVLIHEFTAPDWARGIPQDHRAAFYREMWKLSDKYTQREVALAKARVDAAVEWGG